MPTPLINGLRVQGGTFYTFASSARDISKTFTDDDARFVFSKFVLLDIPNVETPSGNYENFVVWEGLGSVATGGTSSVPSLSSNQNQNIAESLQNYLLNHEQLVLEGANNLGQAYDTTQLATVSERIFWKWMAQINAIRFRNANANETGLTRYVEEDQTQYYRRVVKYIGDIDVVNNVSRDGHTYSEVYMHVPTNHGSTPLSLFKTYQDTNYAPGRQWQGGNYIDGRDSGSTHPTGLDLTAFYDADLLNSYTSNSTFGDITNNTGTAALPAGSAKPVRISNMDGIVLDFDPVSYKPITDDATISLISEFNASAASTDFQFNAALVYYDTYKASTPGTKSTNLYGILILDDYVNDGAGFSYLKRFDKFKPNQITKLNGNSYSLKLNLKFDTSADNVGVETIINDYNTFSMDLFVDASTRLQEAADMFLETEQKVIEIRSRLDALEQFYFTQTDLDSLAQQVSALESALNNSQATLQSNTALLDLINQNADNINDILSGNLSTQLSYNTEVLKKGDGIILDKSVPNQVKIISKVQEYNTFSTCKNTSGFFLSNSANGLTPTSITNGNVLVLGAFGNYFRQTNQNSDPSTGIETFQDTLYINVEDKSYRWKNGQVLRIVFNDKIDTNGFNIVIRTDSENTFGSGTYGKTIGIISSTSIISNRPIIEVICTDENSYNFNIDIIR
jgi:hypothetical protein